MEIPSIDKPRIIIVRQTLDPYVDNVQYIAESRATLELNGQLDMDRTGLGKPGDQFIIVAPGRNKFLPYQGTNIFDEQFVERNLCYEGDRYPVVTVVESDDEHLANGRAHERMCVQDRAEQIAYWKGLVKYAVSQALSIFYPSKPSNHAIVPGVSSSSEDTISGPHDVPSLPNSTATMKEGHLSGLTHRLRPVKHEDSDSELGLGYDCI